MVIDYDHNPNATVDQKLQSLRESIQLALNELESDRMRDHTSLEQMINGSGFITAANIVYCTCDTAAATVAKEATIVSGELKELEPGVQVLVKFTNANSKANPTLKVGSTDAKAIMRYGTTAPSTSAASSWNAGSPVLFVYDGTAWQMVGWVNTTYSSMTVAEYEAGTGTTARIITPARLKAAIQYWIANT